MADEKQNIDQQQQDQQPPSYVITTPHIVEGKDGKTRSRLTKKHVMMAVVSVVITALVVVGIIVSVRIFADSEVQVLKYQLKLKDKDNNDVEQDVSTEGNAVQYHVKNKDAEAWILQDFDKNIEVSRVKTDGGVTCYLAALNRSNAQEPKTIPSAAPTPGDDTPSTELVYKVSETPVSDISFLGNRATKLCSNVPTYWMVPSCGDAAGSLNSTSDSAVGGRSKRATVCATCRGYTCVCGCCSYVCGRFASSRYTWYYANGRYYCSYRMYYLACAGSLLSSRCYLDGKNYYYPWS